MQKMEETRVSISVKNVRGLVLDEFVIPEVGVHVLTGRNGVGKSTLLAILHRTKDSYSLANNLRRGKGDTDNLSGAEIIFTYRRSSFINSSATLRYKNTKWASTPKRSGPFFTSLPYSQSYYLKVGYDRVEPNFPSDDPKRIKTPIEVSKKIAEILGDDRFEELYFEELNGGKCFQIKVDSKKYISEQHFSLGQLCVIRIVDYLENCAENALLLIDEVDLALAPIAVARLHDYLVHQSRAKKLTTIVATHSPILINKARKIIYIQEINNKIKFDYDAWPAQALKDVILQEEILPDMIFFTEDNVAGNFLHEIIRQLRNEWGAESSSARIIPLGGWTTAIDTFKEIKKHLLSKSSGKLKDNAKLFLDEDVRIDCNGILERISKSSESSRDREIHDKLRRLENEIVYLPFTPELFVSKFILDATNHQKLASIFQGMPINIIETIRYSKSKCDADVPDLSANTSSSRKWSKTFCRHFENKLDECGVSIPEYQKDLTRVLIDQVIASYKDHINNVLRPVFS